MAGEKSGDNKTFQLVSLIITTIVAPITVFLVTNGIKANQAAAPTPVPTAVAAAAAHLNPTQPAPTLEAQPTLALSPTETVTAAFTPTLPLAGTGTLQPTWTVTLQPTWTVTLPLAGTVTLPPTWTVTLPPPTATVPTATSTPLPSATPVSAGQLTLSIERKDVVVQDNLLILKLRVRSTASQPQTLVYSAEAIQVRDDTGKVYAPYFGEKKQTCKPEALAAEKKVQIAANKEVLLQSAAVKEPAQWCGKNSAALLPLYTGPLSKDAAALILHFSDFGPFQDVTIEVRLK